MSCGNDGGAVVIAFFGNVALLDEDVAALGGAEGRESEGEEDVRNKHREE